MIASHDYAQRIPLYGHGFEVESGRGADDKSAVPNTGSNIRYDLRRPSAVIESGETDVWRSGDIGEVRHDGWVKIGGVTHLRL